MKSKTALYVTHGIELAQSKKDAERSFQDVSSMIYLRHISRNGIFGASGGLRSCFLKVGMVTWCTGDAVGVNGHYGGVLENC